MIRFFTEKPAKNVVETDEAVGVAEEEDEDNKENGVGIGSFGMGVCSCSYSRFLCSLLD